MRGGRCFCCCALSLLVETSVEMWVSLMGMSCKVSNNAVRRLIHRSMMVSNATVRADRCWASKQLQPAPIPRCAQPMSISLLLTIDRCNHLTVCVRGVSLRFSPPQ